MQEGILFEHTNGSNNLKITVTENCTTDNYSFYSNTAGLYLTYGGDIQYVYLFSDGSQKNLYTNGFFTDPYFYLDLNINLTGKLELTKTNTNGDLVNGSKFHVWSDETGYDEIITVTNGKIVVENLKPGTYKIQEQATGGTGYILNTKVYSTTVKSNETTKQTIVNDEPTRNYHSRKEKRK